MAEFRKDPILGEWVIVAPDRATRPFDHEQHGTTASDLCPFCAGNEGATPDAVLTIPTDDSPESSPDDWAVRVIPNRYPAVANSTDAIASSDYFERAPAVGYHEVIVENPSHEKSMRDLSIAQIARVMRAWRNRLAAVSSDESIVHTMIFKNEGPSAGASLEHVHSQLLATSFIPPKIEAELTAGQKQFDQTGNDVWSEMIDQELENGSRIVATTDEHILHCPFASRFSGQMFLCPKASMPGFESTTDRELTLIAKLLKTALESLNDVFPEAPFNLGLHTAPPRDARRHAYRWHLTITPRLTGIAGFEIGSGSWINVVSPEDAAARFRGAIG